MNSILEHLGDEAREKRWKKKDREELEIYTECVQDDMDIDLVYNPKNDGIEEMYPNLEFGDWFKHFRPDEPIHPLLMLPMPE